MNLSRRLKLTGAVELNMAPFVGVFFLVITFFALIAAFSRTAFMTVTLPKTVTSETFGRDDITIIVTSENIIYVGDKVFTLPELKRVFATQENHGRRVFIKADRRATIGRVVDIWGLARAAGMSYVDVASAQGN